MSFLISCPTCDRDVSSDAPNCPSCGQPNPDKLRQEKLARERAWAAEEADRKAREEAADKPRRDAEYAKYRARERTTNFWCGALLLAAFVTLMFATPASYSAVERLLLIGATALVAGVLLFGIGFAALLVEGLLNEHVATDYMFHRVAYAITCLVCSAYVAAHL